jgi:hypothetical protein
VQAAGLIAGGADAIRETCQIRSGKAASTARHAMREAGRQLPLMVRSPSDHRHHAGRHRHRRGGDHRRLDVPIVA